MSQEEFFATVVQVLNQLNISYMLTGSVASSFYGEPRSTHDIDFVVVIVPADAKRLVESFDKTRYYLSEEAICEAIEHGNPFNLIDSHTGLKADFWPIKSDSYHQTCFSRRKKHRIFGNDTYIASPEDLILTKLEWYKLSGGSEVQFKDALGIYEVQRKNLDLEYIYKWSEHLGVKDLVDKFIEESTL
ncbi:MAG: hypothetical protein KAW52_04160 [candidate division Zixibacteria bacterium]|nr:hypothetical protein [candidate division Zixibacteria bacterium]